MSKDYSGYESINFPPTSAPAPTPSQQATLAGTVITPTPGRVVWFRPNKRSQLADKHPDPFAAIIAFVHSDRMVNLGVFGRDGRTIAKQNVILVQEGDDIPTTDYCQWMPYQLGQAKKHGS
jgi:hypothetical protein